MYLFSLILGIVLLPEVYTLNCYQCLGSTCTEERCSSGSKCAALGVAVYAGNLKVEDISARSCAQPQECIQGSVNFGVSASVLAAKCCSTDLCNNQSIQAGPRPTNQNGKKCFTCVGHDCTGTLNCLGSEDHCISNTVSVDGVTATVKGCASKEICSALNVPGLSGVIGQNFACCQGDLCNGAGSTSAGLLLLMGPLISLVLFS